MIDTPPRRTETIDSDDARDRPPHGADEFATPDLPVDRATDDPADVAPGAAAAPGRPADSSPPAQPAWNPQPWHHPDDLDGYRTASQRFVERAKSWIGWVVALALVLPAGAGLIDNWLFDRASDDVIEQLRQDPVDRALVDGVLLVTVASCDGGTGSGTAFVAEVDGRTLLLTNRHVVEDAATAGLRTLVGDAGPRIVGTALSTTADLAVLEVAEGTELPPALPLGRDAPAQDLAVRTVGFPLALPFTTTGAVTRTGNRVLLDLQVDPGASGSPVVDDAGTVVAQVYARTTDGTGVATSAAALRNGLANLQPRPLGC